jgi:SOS response regulatory protein OraA/RecX
MAKSLRLVSKRPYTAKELADKLRPDSSKKGLKKTGFSEAIILKVQARLVDLVSAGGWWS